MDIIVDIDGTIADMRHRRHFVHPADGGKKDWRSFFESMSEDIPIEPMHIMLNHLHEAQHTIILCTGRPNNYRQLTSQWLDLHKFYRTYLYMRDEKDNRADFIAKEAMLQKMKEYGLNPQLAFEDKQECVDMWRANGILTLQNSMKELP